MDKNAIKKYIAIDLKSFYVSVECAERDLDLLEKKKVTDQTVLTLGYDVEHLFSMDVTT